MERWCQRCYLKLRENIAKQSHLVQSTAFNLLAGKSGQHGSGGHQSGLGGLAQTLLSSGSSHGGSGGSSHGGSAGKIVGQLAGSLLSGKKPSSHSGGGGSGSGHQSGGGGLVGSLLGGLGGVSDVLPLLYVMLR